MAGFAVSQFPCPQFDLGMRCVRLSSGGLRPDGLIRPHSDQSGTMITKRIAQAAIPAPMTAWVIAIADTSSCMWQRA